MSISIGYKLHIWYWYINYDIFTGNDIAAGDLAGDIFDHADAHFVVGIADHSDDVVFVFEADVYDVDNDYIDVYDDGDVN